MSKKPFFFRIGEMTTTEEVLKQLQEAAGLAPTAAHQ